jgi:hypothetical protein
MYYLKSEVIKMNKSRKAVGTTETPTPKTARVGCVPALDIELKHCTNTDDVRKTLERYGYKTTTEKNNYLFNYWIRVTCFKGLSDSPLNPNRHAMASV